MMDWNRSQQVVHKWQPFGVPHVQIQHEQIPHHIEIHHVDANQPPLIQPQQHQPQPQIIHQTSKASKSSTPHCLICNVHLGMFAKGGMEVFSDKVTTSLGKQQIHCVLGNILNEDLSTHQTHSNIICKKCFKLIDDIDALEDKLGNMKQVVSNKYTMTLSLVKRGMIGKAVVDEHTKDPLAVDPKKKGPSASPQKGKLKNAPGNKGRKVEKTYSIHLKNGKIVVRQPELDYIEDETIIQDEPADESLMDEDYSDDELGSMSTSFMCSVCDKPFAKKAQLVKHMVFHNVKEDWHPCRVCYKKFLSAKDLSKHEKTHKNKKVKVEGKASKKDKYFQCHYCSEVFSTLNKVKDHETIHTGEKRFECELCGKRYRQRSNLLAHKKMSHSDIKKFTCEYCGKAFKWKKVWQAHTMSVHTGERPYKCEYCDAGFVYQQHYKKHMRIHTGEKPYSCDICGKAFNSSYNCRSHMFTHTNKKPYECGVCGTGFMRKPLLLTHIMQHTHIEDPEAYIKMNSPGSVIEEMNNIKMNAQGGIIEEINTELPNSNQQGPSGVKDKTPSKNKSKKKKVVEFHPQEQLVIEENVSHFIAPADNREQSIYVFGSFQSPQTVTHHTSLNMGQW